MQTLIFLLSLCQLAICGDIKIQAFNVQVFGTGKQADPEWPYIVNLVSRADLSLIQEIRDVSETALPALVSDMKTANGIQWSFVVGKRQGRGANSNTKEQYAYIWDSNKISLVDSWDHVDTKDIFERPPFIGVFTIHGSSLGKFALVALHSQPSAVVPELQELSNVHSSVVQRLGNDNVLLLGDFNADCTYLKINSRTDERNLLPLWTDKKFKWIVSEDVDTTVAATDCTYDRMVVTGAALQGALLGNASAYKFDAALKLTESTTPKAIEVSDHYPIEVLLRGQSIASHAPLIAVAIMIVATAITGLVLWIRNKRIDNPDVRKRFITVDS